MNSFDINSIKHFESNIFTMNYKVVDLVEYYVFIVHHMKKL